MQQRWRVSSVHQTGFTRKNVNCASPELFGNFRTFWTRGPSLSCDCRRLPKQCRGVLPFPAGRIRARLRPSLASEVWQSGTHRHCFGSRSLSGCLPSGSDRPACMSNRAGQPHFHGTCITRL